MAEGHASPLQRSTDVTPHLWMQASIGLVAMVSGTPRQQTLASFVDIYHPPPTPPPLLLPPAPPALLPASYLQSQIAHIWCSITACSTPATRNTLIVITDIMSSAHLPFVSC